MGPRQCWIPFELSPNSLFKARLLLSCPHALLEQAENLLGINVKQMINLDNTWSWSLLCFIPFLFCNAIDWNSTNATSHGIESWSITIEGGVKWTKKPRSYKRWLVASKCSPQDLKRRSSVSSDCRAATRITLSGQPLKSFRCLAQTTLVKTITVMLHLHFDAAEWNTWLSYVYFKYLHT